MSMRSSSPQPPTREDRESRANEERAQQSALKLQRKQRLEALVRKRQSNLAYLKKFHQGGVFWLNAILFSKEEIQRYVRTTVPRGRAQSFFMLGLSIAKLLYLPRGIQTVRGFSQLMEEWEYHHSGSATQSIKYVMAKNSPCIYPQTLPIEGMNDLTRPSIYRFNNTVVYEYLDTTTTSLQLDYVEVLIALCETLSKLYEKLYHEESYNNQVVYDTIVRLDMRVKHHIINMIAKELTEISTQKVKANTNFLRAIAGHRSADA